MEDYFLSKNNKTKILILGTFHMGATSDLFKLDVDNLNSTKRQKEIHEVVERLINYKPTKIAVEVQRKHNKKLNEQYLNYLTGKYELEINEVDQIGFRIAQKMNHREIYGIDWMERGVAKKDAGDIYEWAKTNTPQLFDEVFSWLESSPIIKNEEYKSILEMYRDYNEPDIINKLHASNINIARIKSTEEFIGLDWLLWWYQRNLIIFSNLAELSKSTKERILLIVGIGHVKILSNFLEESELFELEPVSKYL